MWFDWGVRLLAILALLTIISGLLVLALPETMEGDEMVELDNSHSINAADLIGAVLVAVGAVGTWAAVWTWQRKRLEQ